MSYNLVDPTTGDLTRVAGNSNIVDSAIGINSTWSSKKINDSLVNIESALDELENIPRLTDFDEAIPEKGKNKIYYVNKTIGTYECAQWRVESMYYDVSGLNQYRGVQKVTSLNGVDNIMLMREYYSDSNNVMRWSAWQQLATQSMLPEFKSMDTGDADQLRSFAEGKLYSLKVANAFNVVDDGGTSYQIPAFAEATFFKHAGDLTVQFHSYYGETGIWEVFYNSNGQTRGKKIV